MNPEEETTESQLEAVIQEEALHEDAIDSLDHTNLFVKYLPSEVTDTGLYAMFSPYGEIISCKVMVDTVTGNSLGYGFVRFGTCEEAQSAISAMSGTKYGNKTLLCKLSNSASINNSQPSDNLYIKPLLPSTSEDELRELFGRFGNVKECKVMVNKHTGMSRQIGFVRFSSVEEATVARHQMNGFKMVDSAPPLVVKYAETSPQKAARRAKILANQNAASARNAATFYHIQQRQAQTAIASMYSLTSPALPYVVTDTYGNVTYAPSGIDGTADEGAIGVTVGSPEYMSPGSVPIPIPMMGGDYRANPGVSYSGGLEYAYASPPMTNSNVHISSSYEDDYITHFTPPSVINTDMFSYPHLHQSGEYPAAVFYGGDEASDPAFYMNQQLAHVANAPGNYDDDTRGASYQNLENDGDRVLSDGEEEFPNTEAKSGKKDSEGGGTTSGGEENNKEEPKEPRETSDIDGDKLDSNSNSSTSGSGRHGRSQPVNIASGSSEGTQARVNARSQYRNLHPHYEAPIQPPPGVPTAAFAYPGHYPAQHAYHAYAQAHSPYGIEASSPPVYAHLPYGPDPHSPSMPVPIPIGSPSHIHPFLSQSPPYSSPRLGHSSNSKGSHRSSRTNRMHQQPSSSENCNLFIFHLPASVDDDVLYRLFSPFGHLRSVKVMLDAKTGLSRGFGFVEYFRFEDAMNAINVMNSYPIENKHLKVAFKNATSTSGPNSPSGQEMQTSFIGTNGTSTEGVDVIAPSSPSTTNGDSENVWAQRSRKSGSSAKPSSAPTSKTETPVGNISNTSSSGNAMEAPKTKDKQHKATTSKSSGRTSGTRKAPSSGSSANGNGGSSAPSGSGSGKLPGSRTILKHGNNETKFSSGNPGIPGGAPDGFPTRTILLKHGETKLVTGYGTGTGSASSAPVLKDEKLVGNDKSTEPEKESTKAEPLTSNQVKGQQQEVVDS